MRTIIRNLLAAMLFVAASFQVHAQGFVYDQQSATGPTSPFGNDFLNIQEDSPLLQSFMPTLSAIGFVQFEFADIPGNGTSGATVYVNLWTGSPNTNSATLLGSTTPVYMPNGFQNSGFGVAGVTNFYFSTPVTLTSGQTYYLQPVVQSGDDPWDIMDLTNTYPNGQIFASGVGLGGDFWFREGIVSTPEPSTLALAGLSSLLIFVRKRCRNFLLIIGLSTATLVHAQTYFLESSGPIPAPYPFDPYGGSEPMVMLTNNVYLIEDNADDFAAMESLNSMSRFSGSGAHAMGEPFSPGSGGDGDGGGYEPNFPQWTPPTNGDLWLENLDPHSTNLLLRLHNTVEAQNYQLLSTTNLTNTNWDLGEIYFYADDTQIDYSPIPKTNPPTFFKAHHALPVMALYDDQDSQEPTNGTSGQVGIIGVYNEIEWYVPTNDITVHYTVSGGTAQSGVDYSNLSGSVTITASNYYAPIYIYPIADGLKPDQTIVLTLVQNTNYLIDVGPPSYLSATNTLFANPEVVPIAYGDNEFLCPNTSVSINLTNGAGDPLGLPLTCTILTWPTNGFLNTNSSPSVIYTPNTNYEGNDSFTFKVNDGQHDSAPTNVTLIISSGLYATSASFQTCRGASVGFGLNGGAGCGDGSYAPLATNLAHGTLDTNSLPYVTYTPSTNFTGTDSFNYIVHDECGYSTTGMVSFTVGDAHLQPNPQDVTTGTNRPVTITLSASDSESCSDDASNYSYTIVTSPTHGTLSGSGVNRVYSPNTNYEGLDTFQFVTSDGAWTSTNSATVTNFVVAGPILMAGCNPFATGPFAKLDWVLDEAVQQMQTEGLNITDFIISRSTNSGGPYTAIYTNTDISQMSYSDTSVVAGQTNYYVVTFESSDSYTGNTYESPFSNELMATGHNAYDLISADAIWVVTDVTTNRPPERLGNLPTPFSSVYTNQYPNLLPLPNTYWPAASNNVDSMWSNHIVLVIPTNIVSLSQVQYSIAIDNDYWLYLNNATNYIDTTNHDDLATWAPFKPFTSVSTNLLHYGTNDIGVVIRDRGDINYFSMVVTTNTCGW